MRPAKIVLIMVPVMFGLVLFVVSAEARRGSRSDSRRGHAVQRHVFSDMDRLRAKRMMGIPVYNAQRDRAHARRAMQRYARDGSRHNNYPDRYRAERRSVGSSSLESTARSVRTPIATRTSYAPRIPFIPSLPGD